MNQIIDSKISNLKSTDKEFSFTITTQITSVNEQNLSNPELYKTKKILSLTSNPESYKREILNPINFANELRIALINNVETIAIEDIDIITNTTFLADELLKERFKLVTLKINDYSLIWTIWESDSYELSGTIDVTADKNDFSVTTDMIKIDDKRVRPVSKVLLITLSKGQKIKGVIRISKGIGGTYYRPVSTVGYEIINNTTVKLTPKSKDKIPNLFVLFYALTYLENEFLLFEYNIDGKVFDKDKEENIILVEK